MKKDAFPKPELAEVPKKMDNLAQEIAEIDALMDKIKAEIDWEWMS